MSKLRFMASEELLATNKIQHVPLFRFTNKCNFNCKYCEWHDNKEGRHIKTEEGKKVVQFIKRIGEKKEIDHITVSGGEPSIHPDFVEIIDELSKIAFTVIFTNMSFDLNRLEHLKDRRIAFGGSFHPDQGYKKGFTDEDLFSFIKHIKAEEQGSIILRFMGEKDGEKHLDRLFNLLNKEKDLNPDILESGPLTGEFQSDGEKDNFEQMRLKYQDGKEETVSITEVKRRNIDRRFTLGRCKAGDMCSYIDGNGNVFYCTDYPKSAFNVNNTDGEEQVKRFRDLKETICMADVCNCELYIPKGTRNKKWL